MLLILSVPALSVSSVSTSSPAAELARPPSCAAAPPETASLAHTPPAGCASIAGCILCVCVCVCVCVCACVCMCMCTRVHVFVSYLVNVLYVCVCLYRISPAPLCIPVRRSFSECLQSCRIYYNIHVLSHTEKEMCLSRFHNPPPSPSGPSLTSG